MKEGDALRAPPGHSYTADDHEKTIHGSQLTMLAEELSLCVSIHPYVRVQAYLDGLSAPT